MFAASTWLRSTEDQAREELVAELSACFLNAHAGILEAEIENSAAYLQGWLTALDEHPYELLREASKEARRAVEFILGLRVG
jgi:antirestriction protein ArdC